MAKTSTSFIIYIETTPLITYSVDPKVVEKYIKVRNVNKNAYDIKKNPNYQKYPKKTPKAKAGKIEILYKEDISKIKYWKETGSLQYTSNISGGGSNGLNTEGAIGGAILGGATGAIIGATIGSQTDPIKTETVEHDSRKIELVLTNAVQKTFPYSYRDAFIKIIPDKEYSYLQIGSTVNARQPSIQQQKSDNNSSDADELVKFKKLFDEGVITREEFNAKKKQILGL